MKRYEKIITIFILWAMYGCLPDSLTNFNEDPPSSPYATTQPYETSAPPNIVYDTVSPFKLQRFIPSQSGDSGQDTVDEYYSSFKLYSTSSTTPFSTNSEMTFSISPGLPDGLTFNSKTGEVSGKATSYLPNTTFTVSGTHASGAQVTTSFDLSVTTKIDQLSYKQKVGKKVLLELSSIVKMESNYYLYNDDGLFSSYHPINDSDYKTIINQEGYKADVVSGSINETYNTVIATIQSNDALFKAGDFIDIGNSYFGKKNKIEKVIYFFDTSSSILDLTPSLSPGIDQALDEAVEYSVSPPLTSSNYLVNFNPSTGETSADSNTVDFHPTQFNFTVRNQNGEVQSTTLWMAFFNGSVTPVNKINYKVSTGDIFKVVLENSSNFNVGDTLSTSLAGTKATVLSKNYDTLQLQVTQAVDDSTFDLGTEVDNQSTYVWPETKIAVGQRFFSVDTTIDISPNNSSHLFDFKITPDLPSGLTLNSTTGQITGTTSSTIKDANFTITAKNILGKEIQTSLAFSIMDPPTNLSYSRDVFLTLSESSTTIDQLDHIVSSGGAKGIVKKKVTNSPSTPILLVKVLEGEFKTNEQIDTSYNFSKPVASISSIDYYDAEFQMSFALDSSLKGSLIINGTDEATADHIAKIVHIDPASDPADLYVRIIKGNFSEGTSYNLNDTNKTPVTVSDITSDNLMIGIPSSSQSLFFPGAYFTTGASSDSSYQSSGIVNYVSYTNDSSISVNIQKGNPSSNHKILNQFTYEVSSSALDISSVKTDSLFVGHVGESFRLAPSLDKGNETNLNFTVSPDLPAGLSINGSTGVIEGTPTNGIEKTSYTVTASNDSGVTTHGLNIKIHEHFKLKVNANNNSTTNAILHIEGQGNNRTDCRVTLDQINNDTSTDTKDILCYLEIGENDLQTNGLSLKVETSGICPFVEHIPFGFFKKKYNKSNGTSVYQATGQYTDDVCKNQWNGGLDIPEYSSQDGITNPGTFGTTYASWTEVCNGECDDGTISVTPIVYQKSGEKKCFSDTNQDGFYDDGETIDTSKTTEASCNGVNDSWNYTCLAQTSSNITQTCTGSKLSCMSGPLSKLTELTPSDINSRLGVVSATNSELSYNYEAPANVNDTDLGSNLNIYLANFTKKNQCKKELSNGQPSAYLYNDVLWDSITKSNEANDSNAGRFHEANPFYTYNCLSNSGEIKARIRLLVREWNRDFTGNSSIDLIDPDSVLPSDNMDNTNAVDSNYIGTTWNQFSDFDDSGSGYNGAPASTCSEDDAMRKYAF